MSAVAQAGRVAAVLVTRSAIAATPIAATRALAERIAALPGVDAATYAFTDNGEPSLHDTVFRLRGEGFTELLLLPLIFPVEPSLRNWLGRALARWREADPGTWPAIRLAPPPAAMHALDGLLEEMVGAARAVQPLILPARVKPEGCLVPAEKRRALMCQDYPCSNAGSATLWQRLRRAENDDVACARTSCLGPCSLAPVVQVFPEGTYYCGIDEEGLDRIIASHLVGGEIVEELAYAPTGRKQRLRGTGQ
jgi:(2Fe-2S) ferredoxin